MNECYEVSTSKLTRWTRRLVVFGLLTALFGMSQPLMAEAVNVIVPQGAGFNTLIVETGESVQFYSVPSLPTPKWPTTVCHALFGSVDDKELRYTAPDTVPPGALDIVMYESEVPGTPSLWIRMTIVPKGSISHLDIRNRMWDSLQKSEPFSRSNSSPDIPAICYQVPCETDKGGPALILLTVKPGVSEVVWTCHRRLPFNPLPTQAPDKLPIPLTFGKTFDVEPTIRAL